ncbi:phage tail protein [Escherichia coli]|uniref:tail fiber protein n=3 Tax=Escherichia coli TaxID=562 RepID=UPI000DDB59F3|nr:phage tail protein [Escherichia coli]EFF1273576.1 phage tail protein [Escherichia coli]EFK0816042.1 phage tail protein [Escherichia coli]EHC5761765.1 phage tail protein [Escherichia coli]EIG6369305.1 tail fiber protein [Escherichia coli]RBB48700.1 phage tail protein [Escherichia coli O111:H-]
MNDVTVVTSVTYPSPESLALVADVQYHEPYLSAALNRKFRGIVDPGFYAGFLPKPGGGMNLLITSVDGDKTAGAASVDIGEFYQVTIQHRKDISLALSAGKKYAIVLKGRYLLGEDTYQVNTASHIHAAEFIARTYTDSYQLGDGELLVCTVNIPAGVSAITQEMIDTSERINRTIGIDISDSVTSTRSDVAASSLAVKKAYDLAKSKYTAQDASTTQKGLVQLSSATNSDSETMAATPKAVKSIKDLADTKAPIESPSLTGTPTAPTAAQGTNSTQIANTAFVKAAITALINGAPGTLDTLKEIAAAINNDPNYSTTINNALALKAPLASPALTGVPTAPTAAQGTNNTQIATTAYVRAAISALVGSSPEALDTLNELAAALGNDPNFATTMTNALAGKQPLDATLTALAGLATGANKLPYFTGTDTVSQTDLTSVGRDILAKTSVLAVIQYLGLRELGTSGEKIPLLSTANTWSARQIFNGGITGALTGNADTATKLKTARTIGGVAFDGTANINLPGVNVAGNQNTSGNAATATKLQTACTINGVSFDGSKNIELTAEDLNLQEFINKANNAVQRSGDILSGGLTFENDSILAWIRNTDWAKIGFKNDADGDTDSYMWFETGDNGNEYFKWRSRQSTTTKDLMTLKWDALNILVNAVINGCFGVGTTNALGGSSIVLGDNDTGFKQNGDGILDVYANSQRVFRFQNGVAIAFKNIQAGDSKKFSLSSSNTSTKNATFNLWGASTRPVVAELGDEAGWHFYSQRNTDNSVIFAVNGQMQPSNWGNFDSRYVKDVRLGTRVVQLMARGGSYEKAGHTITGLRIIGEVDGDDEAIFRPIQKYINGTWYNVAQV